MRLLGGVSLCLTVLALGLLATANGASAHFIFTCDGYRHDPGTHEYKLPKDCGADPYRAPATHQWLVDRAPEILRADGHGHVADLLARRLSTSNGFGNSFLDGVKNGVTVADTGWRGTCTDFGWAIGWPLADHMLNPYRRFGAWSYSGVERLGWEGFLYVESNGRTTGSCASAPRVRSTSAAQADEFFKRAQQAWREGRRSDAMFNLGMSVHVVQDATVPSHTHPEVRTEALRIRSRCCGVVQGRDAFPAWANVAKDSHRIRSGGLYGPPRDVSGVNATNTPGGWVYWMAALSYPYYPWSARWSAITRDAARCDVTDFPEECPRASATLLKRAQAVTAGYIAYFFASVGA